MCLVDYIEMRETDRMTKKHVFDSRGFPLTQAEYDALIRSVGNLTAALEAKQAKIDALMLEFCPGEMSKEQREEWAKHQQPHEPSREPVKVNECICPRCGIRHGGSSVDGGF